MSSKADNVIPFPYDRIKRKQTQEDVNKIVEKATKKKVVDSKKTSTSTKNNVVKLQCDKLQIEMEDGSWWEIPAKIVAEHKANNAANLSVSDDMGIYEKTVTEVLQSEEVLIDWAEKEMEWDDVSKFALLVNPPRNTNYDSCWKEGMKKVVKRGKKD